MNGDIRLNIQLQYDGPLRGDPRQEMRITIDPAKSVEQLRETINHHLGYPGVVSMKLSGGELKDRETVRIIGCVLLFVFELSKPWTPKYQFVCLGSSSRTL